MPATQTSLELTISLPDSSSSCSAMVKRRSPGSPRLVSLPVSSSSACAIHLTLPQGVPNAALFTLNKEDHTIGNLLRHYLVKSPNVLFAAYKTPHPLFATIELRVQTDGEISPKDAVIKACTDVVQELQKLDQEFTKEWELKKIAGQGRTDL